LSNLEQTFPLLKVLLVMIVPLTIDLPRSIFKALALLAAYVKRNWHKRREGVALRYPFLSVIVPAHNEEDLIERCLEALISVNYPRLEIIVVDDGSTDKTYEKASKYAVRGLIKLVRREKTSGRKAIAVNHGLKFTRGDIIVVIDADTVIGKDSLTEVIQPLLEDGVGAVAGNIRVLNEKENFLTKLQSYEYMLAMEVGRLLQSMANLLLIVPGAFGAFRRRIVEGVGEYDVDTITEDFDLTIKIHKVKQAVRFAPNAIAWTVVPATWRGWVRQRVRWAKGQIITLAKHWNLLFKARFGRVGTVGVPDMIFMDVVLLFLRIAWIVLVLFFSLISFSLTSLMVFALIVTFYMVNELIVTIPCFLYIEGWRGLKRLAYAPLMVLLYRPLHSLVRLKAYLEALVRKETGW